MKSAVVLVSGGLDSAVLMWHLKNGGYKIRALSVNYGQRHGIEIQSASRVCQVAEVEHRVAHIGHLRYLFAGSSQTSDDVAVPEGHYTDESMKITVVPNRNMVMLSLATAWAISTRSDAIAYAAHSGDRAVYPDCRQEFTDAMEDAIYLCDSHSVELLRPFVSISKADIVKIGARLDVPFELTFSCYKGGEIHCGRCSTCVERLEAFSLAGVPDPTEYLDPNYWRGVTSSRPV